LAPLLGRFVFYLCCSLPTLTLTATLTHRFVGCRSYLAANRRAPQDGKNLARCFPGKAKGSHTERVAFTLSADFISQKEVAAVIDLHSAGQIAKMVTLCVFLMLIFD